MGQDILIMHLKGKWLKEEWRWTRVEARSDWCGRWCHKLVLQHNADDTHTVPAQEGSTQPCVNKTWGKWAGPKGEGFATGTNHHQLLFAFLYFLSKFACLPTSSDNCKFLPKKSSTW